MVEHVHLYVMTTEGMESICGLTRDNLPWKGTNDEPSVTCRDCRIKFDVTDWYTSSEKAPPRNGDAIRALFCGNHVDTVHFTPNGWKSVFQDGTEYTIEALRRWREPVDSERQPEQVNHPPHYNVGKIEVIDFIEDQKLEFHEGNVVKYVARAEHKGARLEDLRKASWYLNRKIQLLEEEDDEAT